MNKTATLKNFSPKNILWAFAGLCTAFALFALGNSMNPNEGVAQALSPELYNSALAPIGKMGGKIIPASCSIGQPCDATDAFCPCANPTVNITATTLNPPAGTNITWGYTSTNADTCDLVGVSNPAGLGPVFNIVRAAPSNSYNVGPYADADGTLTYTVTCFNADRTQSGSNSIVITTRKTPKVNVQFGGNSSPFLGINSFTVLDTDNETYGQLSWNVTGATLCSASGAWSGSVNLVGSRFVYYSGTTNSRKYYTLTCSNATESLSKTVNIYFMGSGCFIAGTKVTMADGSVRDIETVAVGESIQTSGGAGVVEKLWHIPYKGDIYAFNGNGNYFVTDSHPFMTTEGWKSFSPEKSRKENPDLTVSLLEVGDILLKEDGTTVTLEQVDKKYTDEMVYNFKIEGDAADFYADGYWVHNATTKIPY